MSRGLILSLSYNILVANRQENSQKYHDYSHITNYLSIVQLLSYSYEAGAVITIIVNEGT